ncbi:hypothetical protein SZMC14600_16791 [Saccharomonospora azurea SZMC 14600]|uniref:hypothetical protein n=1 Tax=Saccharomonospora azurea TaxID=40988 RepID=UPI0002400C18|nr:hypothetical protein [Saccharomonospora azurea]EHK85309.1 hypothetical protein SZMC14600_16791 [Saccharomonospora azurea SZMC 14600]
MHGYDIDAFGMLETPEPASAFTWIEPSPAGVVSDRSVPDTGVAAESAAPPRRSAQGGEPPTSSTVSVNGDKNNSAGRDLNQTFHTVVLASEVAEQIARSRQKDRTGRGIQDPEALHRLAARYVTPAELLGESPGEGRKTAFQVLKDRNVLLLGAPEPDCGQFAAASRLGYELSEYARREHDARLIIREELVDPSLSLEPDELLVENEPATVILDCRDAGEGDLRIVQRGLVDLSEQLPHYRSYLIVLLPPGQEGRFEEHFPGRVHELGKPSSVEVLERHVGPASLPGIRDDQAVVEKLEELWPPTVARVANYVRESLTPDANPVAIVRAALDHETVGKTDRLRAVIEVKQRAEDAEWLSLLLSSAVLEGASPQHIAAASDALLKLNKVPAVGEVVPILRASPFVRLRRLEDEGWFDLGARALLPSGVGGEVLRHFWREHPDLHGPLRRWLTELPGSLRALEREELEQLADRAAELAVEGGAGFALGLATDWARTRAGRDSDGQRTSTASADKSRRSIAVRLLTTAATDSALGRQVRDQLWRWSREGGADLMLLTAEVCAGIGAAFPRNALTRLKHLANSDNEDVQDAVLRALRQLGDDLGTSRLLRYLTEWFGKAPPGRLAILATAVDQVLVANPRAVDTDVADLFWRHAVTRMPPDDLRPMVGSWLHVTAGLAPEARSGMIEPLVQATGGKPHYIAYVQFASKPRSVSLEVDRCLDEAVAEVTQQLWTRLDEIDPVWAEE